MRYATKRLNLKTPFIILSHPIYEYSCLINVEYIHRDLNRGDKKEFTMSRFI